MNLAHPKTSAAAEGLIGRVLVGRYLLREVLAEGGMATVYRATRVVAQDDVAVKVMHPQFTRDRGFAQRFRREAQIAWKLNHRSIVRVIDHGAEGLLFFMVMELLDGEDLFDVLRHEKRLDQGVARSIVATVCDALAEAHGQGIVHRDLKPENVFLVRVDGRVEVRVLDFGVAKLMLPDARGSNDSEPILTAMGALLGTPEYLSPEMCRGEEVGPGADIYACGALLYALLTGKPPFVTARPLDVTMKHISEAPRPPHELVPELDLALDAIVLQALAKQPRERQASAAALAEALRALGPLAPLPASLVRAAARRQSGSEAITLALPGADEDKTHPAWAMLDSVPPSASHDGVAGDPKPRPPAEAERASDSAPRPAQATPDAPVKAEEPAPRPPPTVPVTAVSPVPVAGPSVAGPSTKRAPSTVRPVAVPAAERGFARIVVAVVVLAATFSAGVAVGRWSAPVAPAAKSAAP